MIPQKYPSNGVLILPNPDEIIDDGKCFCRIYGRGKPVMLIHGNQGSGYSFASLISWIMEYRLIIPDLPGHGYAPPMEDGFMSQPQMAVDYCFSIADKLNIEQFAVVGHSLGGMIGLLMHLATPERVKSLVLLESFIAINERPKELVRVSPFWSDDEKMRMMIGDAFDDGPGVLWHENFDISDSINKVECPVLELQGESTPKTQTQFDIWLTEKRKNIGSLWQIHRLLECAHFLQFEKPKEVGLLISDFLKT